jgi:leader peptidase (prepilin peptidase)/N-methyltransferase
LPGGSHLTANLPPWLAAIIVSPFIGSFLGVLIRRLPAGQPVMLDRSRCEACGHVLGLRDLLPVGSYLVLRGRCRFCGTRIAPLAWIDWRHLILPDALTLPLVLLGLGAILWIQPEALANHAAAAALAYLLFRLIAWTYRRLRGRDGLGDGDAKLMAAAGAWVGVTALSSVLLGGALLTLLAAVIGAMRRGERLRATARLPLGPGLCAALWLVWLWPDL